MITKRSGFFILLVFSSLVPTLGATELRTVALTDMPLPGLPAGITAKFFLNAHRMNSLGEVIVPGNLQGPGITLFTEPALWSEAGGAGLRLLARAGDATPGLPGQEFRNFHFLSLNDVGQSLFLSDTQIGPAGVWVNNSGGGLHFITKEGDAAPGTPPDSVFGFNEFRSASRINDNGFFAMRSDLDGPNVNSSNDKGIWAGIAEDGLAGLTEVALAGENAPGTESGTVFSSFQNGPVGISDDNDVVFHGFLTGSSITSSNDGGIWRKSEGSAPVLLVREGDVAPGIGGGVVLDSLTDPTVNSQGSFALPAFLSGPGVDQFNDSGVFAQSGNSSLSLVAREGDQAPGAETGAVFQGFGFFLSFNSAGNTAFNATLDTSNSGIWSDAGGSLSLIAQTGDQASGFPVGSPFSSLGDPVLNPLGQTAFLASVEQDFDSGIDSSNDEGIWAQDSLGNLQLLIRKGESIDLDNDPVATQPATLKSFLFGSLGEFNASGQLVFAATVEVVENSVSVERNGVFVLDLPSNVVPEPSGLMLSLILSMAMLFSCRR